MQKYSKKYNHMNKLIKEAANNLTQIVQEPKKKRRCDAGCVDHLFYLRKKQESHKNLDASLTMCPRFQRGNIPP
jgi:hypothetical protein